MTKYKIEIPKANNISTKQLWRVARRIAKIIIWNIIVKIREGYRIYGNRDRVTTLRVKINIEVVNDNLSSFY